MLICVMKSNKKHLVRKIVIILVISVLFLFFYTQFSNRLGVAFDREKFKL